MDNMALSWELPAVRGGAGCMHLNLNHESQERGSARPPDGQSGTRLGAAVRLHGSTAPLWPPLIWGHDQNASPDLGLIVRICYAFNFSSLCIGRSMVAM